jgi:hypothetical protein
VPQRRSGDDCNCHSQMHRPLAMPRMPLSPARGRHTQHRPGDGEGGRAPPHLPVFPRRRRQSRQPRSPHQIRDRTGIPAPCCASRMAARAPRRRNNSAFSDVSQAPVMLRFCPARRLAIAISSSSRAAFPHVGHRSAIGSLFVRRRWYPGPSLAIFAYRCYGFFGCVPRSRVGRCTLLVWNSCQGLVPIEAVSCSPS